MPTAFAEALAERTGRDLDALGVAVLGVTGRARTPLAEVAEVVELEPEAGEVEHRVQQHRRVPGRQHEPVAVGPVGVGRVVLHDARPQHVGERRERHRRPGMPEFAFCTASIARPRITLIARCSSSSATSAPSRAVVRRRSRAVPAMRTRIAPQPNGAHRRRDRRLREVAVRVSVRRRRRSR